MPLSVGSSAAEPAGPSRPEPDSAYTLALTNTHTHFVLSYMTSSPFNISFLSASVTFLLLAGRFAALFLAALVCCSLAFEVSSSAHLLVPAGRL